MKKKILVASLVSALALPIATTTYAENNETSGASASSSMSSHKESRNDMRASDLLGKNVRNQNGQDLGKVEDVLVNVESSRVQYTVLSFGGFLGMGDKLFAFPLSAFDRSQQRDHLVLNVSEERLKNAEGFDKNNWPNYRNDPSVFEQARNAFGTESAQDGKTEGHRNLMRLSELVGRDVSDSKGEQAGEIEDVVVDMGRGRVSYVLLEFNAQGSVQDKLVPLPMDALSAPKQQGEKLVLNIDRAKLDEKRSIDRNNWPNLNDHSFQRNMDSYFSTVTGGQKTAQERREQTSGGPFTSDSGDGDYKRNAEMNKYEERRAEAGSADPSKDVRESSGASGESEDKSSGNTQAGDEASDMSGPTQPRPASDTTNRLHKE